MQWQKAEEWCAGRGEGRRIWYPDTNMYCVVRIVFKHVDLRSRSQLYHLTSYDTVIIYLACLSLSCLVYKMELIVVSTPLRGVSDLIPATCLKWYPAYSRYLINITSALPCILSHLFSHLFYDGDFIRLMNMKKLRLKMSKTIPNVINAIQTAWQLEIRVR